MKHQVRRDVNNNNNNNNNNNVNNLFNIGREHTGSGQPFSQVVG